MASTEQNNKISYFAIGRRKTAIAKVTLVPGAGNLLINSKPENSYFHFNSEYIKALKSPLLLLDLTSNYDVFINVKSGGLKSQAEAAKLGIARALCSVLPNKHSELKQAGYLTRDSRSKERKKYGLRKARKAPQYSKR